MIIKRKLRLAMQSAATALTFALATVGSVGATTTIGSNIDTDGKTLKKCYNISAWLIQ